jgi:hypothetical protein
LAGLPWAGDPVPEALDAQLGLFDDLDLTVPLASAPEVVEPDDLLWELEDAPAPAVPSARTRSG